MGNAMGSAGLGIIPSINRQIIHYGVEDGLSQGSVYSMLKDSRGFMWFTSYEGLNRFDGHHFKVYYPDDRDTISLSGVLTLGLVEDPFGNLWVGTQQDGIFVFNPSKAVILHHLAPHGPQAFPENHASFIHISSQGWIGVGTYNGLFLSTDGEYA